MSLFVSSNVLLLMLSVGMSLSQTQFLANWRRLTLPAWESCCSLTEVSPWVVIAVLVLAVGCIAASFAILTPATAMTKTLVVCNVNRHVGLALLLSGMYFSSQKALPAIAAYALAAQLLIRLYANWRGIVRLPRASEVFSA